LNWFNRAHEGRKKTTARWFFFSNIKNITWKLPKQQVRQQEQQKRQQRVQQRELEQEQQRVQERLLLFCRRRRVQQQR
jgi:predicted DNA binding CopG/RHH family protein